MRTRFSQCLIPAKNNQPPLEAALYHAVPCYTEPLPLFRHHTHHRYLHRKSRRHHCLRIPPLSDCCCCQIRRIRPVETSWKWRQSARWTSSLAFCIVQQQTQRAQSPPGLWGGTCLAEGSRLFESVRVETTNRQHTMRDNSELTKTNLFSKLQYQSAVNRENTHSTVAPCCCLEIVTCQKRTSTVFCVQHLKITH